MVHQILHNVHLCPQTHPSITHYSIKPITNSLCQFRRDRWNKHNEVIVRSTHALGSWFLGSYFQMGRLILVYCACSVVLYLPSETHESLLNVSASLGTNFQEEHVVFLCQFFSLLLFHLAVFSQIGLCAYKYLADGLAGVAFDLLDPAADVFEGLLVGYCVGENDAAGALVVSLRYIAEALLTSRVPDLQADLGVVDCDGLDLKVHTNRGNITVLEDSIAELGQEISLPHAAIPDYDHLRQEVLICLLCCHSSIIIRRNNSARTSSYTPLEVEGIRQNGYVFQYFIFIDDSHPSLIIQRETLLESR